MPPPNKIYVSSTANDSFFPKLMLNFAIRDTSKKYLMSLRKYASKIPFLGLPFIRTNKTIKNAHKNLKTAEIIPK